MTAFDWFFAVFFYFGACNVALARLWLRQPIYGPFILWRIIAGWCFLLLCTPYILYKEFEDR